VWSRFELCQPVGLLLVKFKKWLPGQRNYRAADCRFINVPEDEVTKREINTRRKTMYVHIYMFKLVEYDLREIGWGCVDLIGLDQDGDKWRAIANSAMNHRVP
jgi:hypothetical protein